MGEPMRMGIIGLGSISAQYRKTPDKPASVERVAGADLDQSSARLVADGAEPHGRRRRRS